MDQISEERRILEEEKAKFEEEKVKLAEQRRQVEEKSKKVDKALKLLFTCTDEIALNEECREQHYGFLETRVEVLSAENDYHIWLANHGRPDHPTDPQHKPPAVKMMEEKSMFFKNVQKLKAMKADLAKN